MRVLLTIVTSLAFGLAVQAQSLQLRISAKKGHRNTPVTVPLSLPKALAGHSTVRVKLENGPTLWAQLVKPSLRTEKIPPMQAADVRRDLCFVIPEVAAGTTISAVVDFRVPRDTTAGFHWNDVPNEYSELLYTDPKTGKSRPVVRYVKKRYDDSSPQARNESYKVFHHVYDPQGRRFLTNGGYTNRPLPKKLLYPHHRGLMFGFNRITYGNGKKCDTWHCRGDDYIEHVKTLNQEGGPVVGTHRVLIAWHGSKQDVFATEQREVTVWNVPGGILIDWSTRLETTGGPVMLDGDPQHAGFQFRAHNDVAEKTRRLTYFLRVDGKGKPGGTRNWNAKNPQPGTIDVPWKAMSFVLDGKRYTVAYLDHPANPGEARHSERDYGRFGYYFQYRLTKERPLNLQYRVWVQEGEMAIPEVQRLHADFVHPPQVQVQAN